MNKTIRAVGAVVLVLLWAGLSVFAWLAPAKAMSTAERRSLAQMPAVSVDALLNGTFMEKFEDYTVDQFPLRQPFRTAKSLYTYGVLQQKDNNGIYLVDGWAAQLEYPVNDASLSHALKKLQFIYDNYLQDTSSRIFLTVIPDKGYYLAEANGYPAMDYAMLFDRIKQATPWAETVDITKDLSVAHYYRTDTHWRQEKLQDVAKTLCNALGVEQTQNLQSVLATDCFYGVYYGQAALPMQPDTLYFMESSHLADCRVYNYETDSYQPVYDTRKLSGTDPYEVYLSGSQALLRVENPHAQTGKELIVFRDSFASALIPWLVQDYETVTVVDIRYVGSALLGEYLDFHGQDVLFAYSTLILNNSTSMK